MTDRMPGFNTLAIHAGDGADYMVGGTGDDELYGGLGDDQFFGGVGTDLIVTGEGRDQIVFAVGDGRETVADFDVLNDVINLGSFGFETLEDVLNRSSQQGADTVIDLGDGDVIILANVQKSTLQGADFYL